MTERIIGKPNNILKDAKNKSDWILRDRFRVSRRTKPPYPPKMNEVIGSWTVIGIWTNKKGYLKSYKCKCACGHTEMYVNTNNLKVGNTTQCKSCGQKGKRTVPLVSWNNAVWPERLSNIDRQTVKSRLAGMIARCEKQHHIDNGIKVHNDWIYNSQTFLEFIIQLEGWDNKELIPDRINTRGNYEPGNIRFITNKENARNMTTTKYLTYEDKQYDIASFMETFFGVKKVKDNKKLYNFINAKMNEGKTGDVIMRWIKLKRLV